jgi:hypothetical protein
MNKFVIPASRRRAQPNAGISGQQVTALLDEIPASAGMTRMGEMP